MVDALYSKHSRNTLGINAKGALDQLFSFVQSYENALTAVALGHANLDENLSHRLFICDANLSYVCFPNSGIASMI